MKKFLYPITGPINKLVETFKGYIVNAQYFPKSTMIPVPFGTVPVLGSIRELNLSRGTCIGYAGIYGKYNNKIIVDKNDPTISYVIGNTVYDTIDFNIVKIKETDDNIEVLASSPHISSQFGKRSLISNYLGQNDTHIFVSIDYAFNTTWSVYVGYIDKTTLVYTHMNVINSWANGTIRRVYEDINSIYMFVRYSPQVCDIFRINKTTMTTERSNLLANRYKGTGILYTYDIMIDHSDTVKEIIYPIQNQTAGNNTLDFCNVLLDFSKAPVVQRDVVMTQTTPAPYTAMENLSVNDMYYLKDGADEYLVRVFCEYSTATNATHAPNYGIYVWKINRGNGSLTQVQFKQLSSETIRCSINVDKDCKQLVIGTASSTVFLYWNSTTTQYDITETRFNNPWSIGVSEEEIVYTSTVTGELDIINNNAPSTIIVNSTQSNFTYEGTDIETTVKVRAMSPIGEQLAYPIKLNILGNIGVFKSNNLKSIEIVTDKDADLEIPIILTNGGTLYFNYDLN